MYVYQLVFIYTRCVILTICHIELRVPKRIYSYGQKSCRVKCLDAIYAHTLWKAISPEPLGLQYLILHIWNLCVKTNNLSTFGGLYDPPLKSSYNLKNEEEKIKIVKNRFFFQLAQF